MKVAVIVNAGAGSVGTDKCEERVREIRAAFAAAEVEAEIVLCEPARLTETARQLAGAGAGKLDAIVAAGGDGTVSGIAAGLVGSEVPLAVLPLGTLNHFARDIAMPSGDLETACRAIRDGKTEAIDVGEVNGHLFINNSSIGLYPEAVMRRDVERKQGGRRKWTAMLLAIARVFKRFPLLSVCLATPERSVVTKTPFVFIGNNEYSTDMRTLGQRTTLDSGHLSLYTVRCRGRWHLLYLLGRALFSRVEAVRSFETASVTEATVMLRRRRLTVALDGEVVRMSSPLRYRIHPGVLRVIRGTPETADAMASDDAEVTSSPDLAPARVVDPASRAASRAGQR